MSRYTYLTPALFQELDTLARIFAGKPIIVEQAEEMGGCFGYTESWAQGLLVHWGGNRYDEKSCITLANKIDLKAFAQNKAGVLDLASIPWWNVYRFVVWHEIAHVIHLGALTYFGMDMGTTTVDTKRRVYRLAEARADRYAWDVLYPGKEMPLLPGADAHLAEIEETTTICRAILEKEKRHRPIEPLSTDPFEYIPYPHVKRGIPWAPEVGADPFCLWGAMEDGRIVSAVREEVQA